MPANKRGRSNLLSSFNFEWNYLRLDRTVDRFENDKNHRSLGSRITRIVENNLGASFGDIRLSSRNSGVSFA